MTCNPNWIEITTHLLPGQTAADRPDLVSRVFELKKKELINDLYNKQIFGTTVAYVHTIEFQKRGIDQKLPIHLLQVDMIL